MSAEETEVVRQYYRAVGQSSTRIYWGSLEQKRHYEALASQSGARNFSAWLIRQIERGTNSSTVTRDELLKVRQDLAKLTTRLHDEMDNSKYFRKRTLELERQCDALKGPSRWASGALYKEP